MPPDQDPTKRLEEAIEKILSSESRRKLVVAGPGTGKTTLFRKVLDSAVQENGRLVLTFINNLKDELEAKLSDSAQVFTFHGYCHFLLRRNPTVRAGLSENFRYFPGLASLIKRDWEVVREANAPHFVLAMRNLEESADTDFYLSRANYYDAVDFDDSVFRTFLRLREAPGTRGVYDQILIDEFQDFNKLEASFIELLAERSPILIVGDDDQALYSQLRSASHEFIRGLYRRGDYACFDLPFCMRSPEVVVGAFDDIVQKARSLGKLAGRIDKPYLYFPPRKADDSKRYPKIGVVQTSVQSKRANYIGRVIDRIVRAIPKEEIEESHREGFPTALVIGPIHYLRQVAEHLIAAGHAVEWRDEGSQPKLDRSKGIAILAEDAAANLGWRTILEADQPAFFSQVIRSAVSTGRPLRDLLPDDYRDSVLGEAASGNTAPAAVAALAPRDPTKPSIKLTSFEGSKGLSAQHVLILGLQEGELPRDAGAITDLEICRLLVALTRTRKQCHLIFTTRFGGKPTRASVFLSWIKGARTKFVKIDSAFWKKEVVVDDH